MPDGVVLDPTAATGTTLRVAQRLERRNVGIEGQDEFVELIRKRLEQPVQLGLF